MKKLRLRCRNAPSKCEEVLPYDSIEEHEKSCEFELIPCTSAGCDIMVIKKCLPEHLVICPHLVMDCQYCMNKFKRKELDTHEYACDEKPIQCRNKGCTYNGVMKDYMANHHGKCPYELLECKWCKGKEMRSEHQAHQDSCDYKICKCRGCKQDFYKKDLEEHETACESVEVTCERCGCVMQRKEQKLHDCIYYLRGVTERLDTIIRSMLCSECITKKPCCKLCHNVQCVSCGMNECEECQASVCKTCFARCKDCHKMKCKKCAEAACNVCKEMHCKKCATMVNCVVCNKKSCKECVAGCDKCGKQQCKIGCAEKNLSKCNGCGKTMCVSCLIENKGCSCAECNKRYCGDCISTKMRQCARCIEGPECAQYCTVCYANVKICRVCNKMKAGQTWEKFTKGKDIVTDIPVAYADTHDGGAVMDVGRGFIWSIHGQSNGGKGRTLYKLNPATKTKESFGLPFNTHGSYPVFDGKEYIYVNSSEEDSGNNQLARVHVETGKVEKLQNAPIDFQRYTNGIFRNGILYKINQSNYLMTYDPKTNVWINNVFLVECKANMLADVRSEDGIFLMREDSDLQLYSISKNVIEKTFAAHGKYDLGANANCEIVPDADDPQNCFICSVGDERGYPPKAISLKENTWVPLPWTCDTSAG